MKNVQKLFSMAMLVCMAITMFSCSKDEEEDLAVEVGIIGQWEIESTETLINGQSIAKIAEQAGMSEEEYKKSFGMAFDQEGEFNFMEDKKFEGEYEGSDIAGTWKADGKTLILEYEDGDQREFVVKSLKSTTGALSSIETVSAGQVESKTETILHIEKK